MKPGHGADRPGFVTDALGRAVAELATHKTTRDFLQVPHNQPLPEDLIRRIAEYRVRVVAEREGDAFW